MATEEYKEPNIRGDYQPSEEDLEIIRMVYNRRIDMRDAIDRTRAMKVCDEADMQWEAHRGKKEGWQSNHYVPLTTAIVETALAEMVDQTPRPLILPRSVDDGPKAQVMKHIFDYTWEVADGDTQLYNVMKDTLMYGTAIAQEYHLRVVRKVKNTVLGADGKQKEVEEEIVDFDDSMMEVVKLQDFFVDETARGFDGPYPARDCIRRYIMKVADFKDMFTGSIWDALDAAKYVKPGGDTQYYEFYKPPEDIKHDKEVEVLWYWNKPKDCLYIVANDVLVRKGPNPFKHKQLPFARAVDIKRVHSFYGKGEPELLESIQDEVNILRRMMIDRNHLDIDKMFLVSDTLNLNDDDLIARPHGLIPTNGDVNSAKPIEYGDVPRSVELGYNWLNEDGINVTGIDPRQASSPQPATATEAALLKEAALKKIRMKLRLLEREFLVRVARLRVANIVQFYSQPILEKIVGEEGTAQYQARLNQFPDSQLEMGEDGQMMSSSFRSIRMEGKKLELNEKGEPFEVAEPGFHFFEAIPELFVPVARGGFDIKFAAGATLPLSKPLMQTKTTEMYDRLIQLALGGIGYDPVKLGDALLRVNDFDPEEFKTKEEAPVEEGFTEERMQQLVELANIENEQMSQGNEIPPTGYSAPFHTRIHIEFMMSPTFQDLPPDSPVPQLFTRHVIGEMTAQGSRGGEEATGEEGAMGPESTNGNVPSFQGQGQQNPPAQIGGNTNNEKKQLIPGMIQGGGDVPLMN